MEDGRKAEGFSPHRTNNQGGLPPYLRAASCGGVGVVVGVGSGAGSWLPGLSREATDPPPSRKWWNTVCGLSICLLFCCLLAHCPSLSPHYLLQEQEPSAIFRFDFPYILHILC